MVVDKAPPTGDAQPQLAAPNIVSQLTPVFESEADLDHNAGLATKQNNKGLANNSSRETVAAKPLSHRHWGDSSNRRNVIVAEGLRRKHYGNPQVFCGART
jgi:hypothetical protein